MITPKYWAPHLSLEDAARVYLRDRTVAPEHPRGVVDLRDIKALIMSRTTSNESPTQPAETQSAAMGEGS